MDLKETVTVIQHLLLQGQYNDQVIYNNPGSNKADWSWSGTDNNTGSASRGGPNLLGAKLTMTYDDTVLNQDASDSLDQVQDDLGNLDEQVFDDVQEFFFEENFTFNEQPPQFEMNMPMEMETFEFVNEYVEEFFMDMGPEFMMESEGMEMSDGPLILMADEQMMEEMYEESTEIVASFLPMPSEEKPPMMTETFQEEEMIDEQPPMMTETFQEETFEEEEMIEENPPMMTETFQEEEMPEEKPAEMTKEKVIEEEETVEEKPTKMVKATNEEKKEKVKEEKPDSKSAKKSSVQTKKVAKQEKVQSKTKTTNVKSQSRLINVEKVMAKVDKDIKSISKNLQIKNIIKLEIMASDQASLNDYANTQFYKPKNVYLDQLPIFDSRLIYADKSLASYTQNDKIEIQARKLEEINSKKQQLLIELEVLKNG